MVELHIESLAAGGDGVGRDSGGRVTFVPFSAPGDRVRARVVDVHKDYARAELLDLVVSSGYRVEAPCPHFVARTCGGCQWLHLGSEVQAAAKDELVARLLRRQVEAGMTLYPLRAEVAAHGWRRRARLHWYRPRKADAAVIGFLAPRSHRVSDITGCVQLDPALGDALAVLRTQLAPALGRSGQIELLAGHRGEVHVAIHGRCEPAAAEAVLGQGGIVGVLLDTGTAPGPRKRVRRRFGHDHLELEPGLPGRADWFAQPSRAGNQALIEVVAEAAGPAAGERVLELYAGSGNLTRLLAPEAAAYLAVDRARPPWKLSPRLDQRLRAGDVAAVTAELAAAGERFDLIVLDPPRTGAREVLDAVIALSPARIVYVSCNPSTLARDLDLLAQAGYRATWAQPLDLMPQTAHVEIVVAIERAGRPDPT